MPATPTASSLGSQWIAGKFNGALSNKGACIFNFTSAEVGQHRIQVVKAGTVTQDFALGDGIRAAKIGGLDLNVAITIQVRSENGGLSGWHTLAVTPPAMPVVAGSINVPSGLAVDVATDPTKAIITWTDNANNEGRYRFHIAGPDLYSATFYADPDATSLVIDILAAGSPFNLAFATAYVITIAAQGGKYTLSGEFPLQTAWSAEVAFTTPPTQIVITNLPGSAEAWIGIAFNFEIQVSDAATSFALSSGAFPTGITLNTVTGVVSGATPSGAPGSYIANLRANNGGGHDIEALDILLLQPRFFITEFGSSIPLAGRLIVGNLEIVTSITIAANKIGPIADATTFAKLEGPDWLSFAGNVLSGTPLAAGTFPVTISVDNGTQSATATFMLGVAALRISSADHNGTTIYAGDDFTIQLSTTVGDDATFSTGDLPAGVTLSGSKLIGSIATAGIYTIDLAATFLGNGASQIYTLTITPQAIVDSVWRWVEGQPQVETVEYTGPGTVQMWYLTGQPPGITIGNNPASEGDTKHAVVTGSPGATGIYDTVATAQVTYMGHILMKRIAVRIEVSGGMFLNWFHEDAARLEVQLLLRSIGGITVDGYYFDPSLGLVLPRGDTVTLYIILRDGPIHGDELGLATVETGLSDLKFTVRPVNDYDSEPWISVSGVNVVAINDDHNVYSLSVPVKSAEINARFKELNRNQGADATELSIPGMGELTGTLNSQVFTARRFFVTIRQDIDR